MVCLVYIFIFLIRLPLVNNYTKRESPYYHGMFLSYYWTIFLTPFLLPKLLIIDSISLFYLLKIVSDITMIFTWMFVVVYLSSFPPTFIFVHICFMLLIVSFKVYLTRCFRYEIKRFCKILRLCYKSCEKITWKNIIRLANTLSWRSIIHF